MPLFFKQMKRWLNFYDKGVDAFLNYPDIAVSDILEATAKKYPDRIATVFYSKTTTYSQIKKESDILAGFLESEGLTNTNIALLLPNFPGFMVSYYGVLKAANTVVMLNPLYTPNELSYQMQDSKTEAVITIPLFLDKVVEIGKKLKTLKKIILFKLSNYLPFPKNLVVSFKEKHVINKQKKEKNIVYFSDITYKKPQKHTIDTSKTAVIIYSGGTTGVAKGIMLSHRAIVINAHQISAWGHLNNNESILAVLPLFHGFGMNVCMNSAVLNGMKIILLPRFNAKEMAKTITKEKPTLTAVVPTILTALLNLKNVDRYNFSSLKAIWSGAAPLSKALKENFEKKAACRVIEGYGLTECVTAIMANPYKGLHKIGSIGIPFPDVDAAIVDLNDPNKFLKPEEIGEIALKTPTVMNGYLNKEEETKQTIINGWLLTGDIGYMDEDGYFYITDRKKELIIVGGFNVFPREIEEVLYAHECVKEAAVIGLPHQYKGEMIKAFVVLKDGCRTDEEELKKYLRKNLTAYKIPSEIAFVDDLPKNAIGKILKRKLKEAELAKR